MKISRSVIPVLALFIGACGGGGGGGKSESVDASGNCTSQYVLDYNNVGYEYNTVKTAADSKAYTEREILKKVQVLKNACDVFLTKHSSISCKAEVDYQTKTISSSDKKATCDLANTVLGKTSTDAQASSVPGNNSRPITNPKPVEPVEDNKLLESLSAEQMQIVAMDTEKILRLAADSELVAVNGKIGTIESFSEEIIASRPTLCLLSSMDKTAWEKTVSAKQSLVLAQKSEKPDYAKGRRNLVLAINNGTIGITCVKLSASQFTVKELRSSLAGIFEISIK